LPGRCPRRRHGFRRRRFTLVIYHFLHCLLLPDNNVRINDATAFTFHFFFFFFAYLFSLRFSLSDYFLMFVDIFRHHFTIAALFRPPARRAITVATRFDDDAACFAYAICRRADIYV